LIVEHGNWPERQRAIVEFATEALRGHDVKRLIEQACVQTAAGLGVSIAKLGTIQPDSDDLLLRAEVGLPAGLAWPDRTLLPGGAGSAMGYCLHVGAPVVCDVETETRFDPSDLVRRSGVKISANVVLWVENRPYGCLEADSRVPWQVSEADIDFLQTFANLVSAAIERTLLAERVERLAQQREILLREVFHRIKNLLANVVAIARRTVRYSSSLPEFQASFEGRVEALARAHDLLISDWGQPARLRELLELEFGAKEMREGKDFRLEGPDIQCDPRTIQMLALLVFELATNAVKHGALSPNASPAASIHVRWRIDESEARPLLRLTWRESGVKPPKAGRRGFGSELIEKLVTQLLGGTARLDMHADGIECAITFPLTDDRQFLAFDHGSADEVASPTAAPAPTYGSTASRR
jgi:two-component sensor histidine kinase